MRQIISFLMMPLRLAIILLIFTQPAASADLLMMEQDGCPWCERWHEEIGVIYSKTTEGKRAPLKIINIHQPMPNEFKNIRMERFTPSFVLVENGIEIGRLRGYTGDEFFWFLLGEIIEKLPDQPE